MERASAGDARPSGRELGALGCVSVVALRVAGKRVVRIGEDEAPLAADESVLLRRS